jgi:hypothetical protein
LTAPLALVLSGARAPQFLVAGTHFCVCVRESQGVAGL